MAVDYNRNTFDLWNTVVVKLKQAWQDRDGLFSQTILQFSTLWRHLSSPLSFSPEINSHPLSSDWTVLRVGASFRMEFSLLWRKSVQSATHLHIPLHLHSIALLPSHLHCGQPVVCGSAGTKSRIRKVGSKFASIVSIVISSLGDALLIDWKSWQLSSWHQPGSGETVAGNHHIVDQLGSEQPRVLSPR